MKLHTQIYHRGFARRNLQNQAENVRITVDRISEEIVKRREEISKGDFSDVYEADPGRFDYAMGEGFDDIYENVMDMLGPTLRREILQTLGASRAQGALGCLVGMPGAKAGEWHQDSFPLFGKDIDHSVIPIDRPFYITILIPLQSTDASVGGTEFLDEAVDQDPAEWLVDPVDAAYIGGNSLKPGANTVSVSVEPGECLIFDGRKIHRGAKRGQDKNVRKVLYLAVYKDWYRSQTFKSDRPCLFGKSSKIRTFE